jgi:hypothetical protein
MSIPIQSNPTPVGAYQAYFGALPDGQDKKAECEKWERLCGELLAERERLRAELEKERLDSLCKNFKLELTMEEVYAQVDRECSLEQIIADLERKAGTTA